MQAGASWSYVTASQVVKELCGARLSAEQIRQLTNREGQQEAVKQAAEAQALVEPSATQVRQERAQRLRRGPRRHKKPAQLLVGLDGGWIASREQKGGMEGKVGIVASEVEAVGKRGRHRLSRRRYVATFGNAEQIGRLSYAAVKALEAEEAVKQVVVADGADWIQTQSELHFPEAIKILDWPHLWRKLHAGIRALHPGQSQARRAWRKQQYELLKPLLWQGQVQAALSHLQALRPQACQEPGKAFEELLSYLENQQGWIGNYEQWQQQGYPVGSGMVEREVALVINRRMKRQGMRWKRANADAVVALRVRTLNAAWDKASAQKRLIA